MRHTTTLCSLLAASVLPLSATAQNWTVVDDFESGADAWTINAQLDPAASIIVGEYELAGPGDNYLFIDSAGSGGANWGDTHASRPLPYVINQGETATLYWEAWVEGPSNNWHVHLSDLEAPKAWGENNFTIRWTFEHDPAGVLQGHDGSGYVPMDNGSGEPFFPTPGAWYKFWVEFTVSDNVEVTPNSWSLYVQGPDDATPRGPVALLKEGNPTTGGFRKSADGGLKVLSVSTNTGNPGGGGFGQNEGDLWFLDDFYITLGLHGGVDPINGGGGGDTYGGYTIVDGWIDTPNVGWVYVGDGTELNGWVYSDASEGMNLGWLYMHPDNMSGSGDWVYIPR